MDGQLLARLSEISDEEQAILDGQTLRTDGYFQGRGRIVDSRKLMPDDSLIEMRVHTRFVDFPSHSHNYIEFVYMCSGATTHIINDAHELTLCAGELLLLVQHARHRTQRAGREYIAVNIIMRPEFFDVALELIGPGNALADFLFGNLRHSRDGADYLHFKAAHLLPVQNTVEGLIWNVVNRRPNLRRVNQVTMGLLLLQLLDGTDSATLRSQGAGDGLITGVLREIEENYPRANLSALAQRCGVSVAYLSRLTREKTGYSYKELLQKKRLGRAAQLLCDSDLSVQEISLAVGYDNTSYFHNLFKKAFRQSPSQYRRQKVK